MITLQHYLIFCGILFLTGMMGVVVRRNFVVRLVSVVLMMTSSVILFLAFGKWMILPDVQGVSVLIIMLIVLEVIVGGAMVILNYSGDKC